MLNSCPSVWQFSTGRVKLPRLSSPPKLLSNGAPWQAILCIHCREIPMLRIDSAWCACEPGQCTSGLPGGQRPQASEAERTRSLGWSCEMFSACKNKSSTLLTARWCLLSEHSRRINYSASTGSSVLILSTPQRQRIPDPQSQAHVPYSRAWKIVYLNTEGLGH